MREIHRSARFQSYLAHILIKINNSGSVLKKKINPSIIGIGKHMYYFNQIENSQ